MDLYVMRQVKRLLASADAGDDTRNMDLHLEVAFRIVAEQGAAAAPKNHLNVEALEEREAPALRLVDLTPSYREQKARLAQLIAGALHCRFTWSGSLSQDGPTTGVFVGVALHADRARLLYELIEPDLRLLTRFVGPIEGKGQGPGGAPSGDGLDFFRSRSEAMFDLVTWLCGRLHEIEAAIAAAAGRTADFHDDAQLADAYMDHLWADDPGLIGSGAGRPDLPMVDGIPEERWDELFCADDDDAGEDDEGEVGEYGGDEDDDFDYSFDWEEDDEDDGDEDEEYEGDDDVRVVADPAQTTIFDLGGGVLVPNVEDVVESWVYFLEDGASDDVGPCLIRFGAAGWQLYYPAMDEWFDEPVAKTLALESGLFSSVTERTATHWVQLLANPLVGKEGYESWRVADEIAKCMAAGIDEDEARAVVRREWGNLPDALLTE